MKDERTHYGAVNQTNRSVVVNALIFCIVRKKLGPCSLGLMAGWQMKYGWIMKFLKFSTSYNIWILTL